MTTIADLIRREGREPGGGPARGQWYHASAWFYVPRQNGVIPSFKLSIEGPKGGTVYLDNPTVLTEGGR